MVLIKPKTKNVDDLLEKLIQHPFQVTDKNTTQCLSKYKVVRSINQFEPHIVIKDGMVGLKPNVKIKKKGDKFDFEIF